VKLPTRLNKCPAKPECVAKIVFKDEDTGKLYRLDTKAKEFVPHVCTTKGASEFPTVAYASEWLNTETGKTRYLGPSRARSTVEKAPYDERFRKRGTDANPVWVLKGVFIVADLAWQRVED
jgi:hypothetical protein